MRMKRMAAFGAVACLLSACNSSDEDSSKALDSNTADGGALDGAAKTSATSTAQGEKKKLMVSGPIESDEYGQGTASFVPLTTADYDYTEKEYFFEGTATAYKTAGELTADGKWALEENTTAPFRSRFYVRRPRDASKFSGTVLVEWLNVSGGLDAEPGFMFNYPMLLREGWAYVGVSAQTVGIDGNQGFSITSLLGDMGAMMPADADAGMPDEGTGGPGDRSLPLKQFNPDRYESLTHPGDDYSFDIFSQAGRSVRNEGGVDVLDGLKVERLLAYGESQSAGRMVSYVNGVAPLAKVFDGYFIHSRGATGNPFETMGGDIFAQFSMFLGGGGGSGHKIRDDLGKPVFQFQTETDVFGLLAFAPARQPDSDVMRTWEVAGTAHADRYLTDQGAGVAGSFTCEGGNDGPQHFVIRAGVKALAKWVDGTPPPKGEPLMLDGSGKPVLDENGNVKGGVRSPDVDVPIAVQSGDPPEGGTMSTGGIGGAFCGVFGSTTPFLPEKLRALYPSHDDYVMKVEANTKVHVAAGFLLEPEAQEFLEEAKAADVPPK